VCVSCVRESTVISYQWFLVRRVLRQGAAHTVLHDRSTDTVNVLEKKSKDTHTVLGLYSEYREIQRKRQDKKAKGAMRI
jgi:hypothetical protein